MKILDIVRDANASLLRNKIRTFLTILAIFIGSFSIISTSAIQAGVNSFIDEQVDSYGGNGYLAIVSKDSFEALEGLQGASGEPQEYNPDKIQTGMTPISDEQMEQLKEVDGIDPDSIQPTKNISITYVTSEKTNKKYLMGAEALPSDSVEVATTEGVKPDLSSDDYQVTIEQRYVKALGYERDEDIVGEKIQFAVLDEFTKEEKIFDVEVVGVIAPSVVSMGMSYLNTAITDAIYDENTKYYPEEYLNQVYTLTATFDAENFDAKEVKDALEEIGLSGMTIEDIIGTIKTFFDVILTVFKIFGLIALLAAAIGIINTLFMSVQERTREIGLDKALGMSSGQVFLSFSIEAISLGFWGSAFGIITSMIIGNIANNAFHADGGFLEKFPTFNLATYTIQDIIMVTVLIMVIAFIAGTLPARQAAHKDPIDALRYE